jgi:hypothetical protein
MRAIDVIFETLAHFVKRDDTPPPGIPARVEPQFEREFVSLCDWHSLSPVVAESLGRLALGPVLSDFGYRRLRSMAAAARTRNETVIGDLSTLVAAFEEKRLSYMVMDDARSALALYPDPGLRPIETITLLVREQDWDEITGICGGLGYERDIRDPEFNGGDEALEYYQHFSPCRLRNERGTELVLTFRLFDLGGPESEEAAWSNAQRIEGGAVECMVTGLGDHFLRTCMRLNMTRFERLMYAVDAGLLMSQHGGEIDWAYIDARARARSMYPALYCAGDWVRSTLAPGATFPLGPPPGRIRRNIFELIWRPGRPGLLAGKRIRLHRFRFYFIESGRVPDKIRLVTKIVSPRPDWVSAFFGSPYKPWLKIRFIVNTFRYRLGTPLPRGEDLHYQ